MRRICPTLLSLNELQFGLAGLYGTQQRTTLSYYIQSSPCAYGPNSPSQRVKWRISAIPLNWRLWSAKETTVATSVSFPLQGRVWGTGLPDAPFLLRSSGSSPRIAQLAQLRCYSWDFCYDHLSEAVGRPTRAHRMCMSMPLLLRLHVVAGRERLRAPRHIKGHHPRPDAIA